MHQYLRAVGFSEYRRNETVLHLLEMVRSEADSREELKTETADYVFFDKHFNGRMGIRMCCERFSDGNLSVCYYFPYLTGSCQAFDGECTIVRHTAAESYSAFCEDSGLGISLIFFLQNPSDYLRLVNREKVKDPRGHKIVLTGLSTDGKILLPVLKTEKRSEEDFRSEKHHKSLVEKAKNGDQDAIEELTMEDIDLYAEINRRMANEDICSIVDTSFMPTGVECDHYSIIGEILDAELIPNGYTGEQCYILTVESYDVTLQICINAKDLLGEPMVGRRFRGDTWVQGAVEF